MPVANADAGIFAPWPRAQLWQLHSSCKFFHALWMSRIAERERERACSCFMFHKKQFVPHQCCTLVSPPVQVKACQILAGQKCRRTPSRKRWIQEGAVGFNVNELKLQSLPTWILHAVQANVSTWLSCVIAAFRPQACVQDLTRKKAAAVTRNRRRLVQSFLEFEAETQSRCCNLLAQYGLFE